MSTYIWMSLEDAATTGINLDWVREGIGPRRPGTLYYGSYWHNMNQVLEVSVRVDIERRTTAGWEISEYSIGEQRIRHHCTPWEYGRGNRIHHGPGDMRRTLTP